MRIGDKLHEILKGYEGDKMFAETVIGTAELIRFVNSQPAGKYPMQFPIDQDVLDEMKGRYEKLDLDQLILLWTENYHSLMIKRDRKGADNIHFYMARHKVSALGQILVDTYLSKNKG